MDSRFRQGLLNRRRHRKLAFLLAILTALILLVTACTSNSQSTRAN